MIVKLMDFEPLREGTLIKRYKRFLADIKLNDGKIVTAHCPNTGPMKGLINSRSKVRLSYSPNPKRKLSWTWEQVEVINKSNQKHWVGINTLLANKLIRRVIEKGLLKKYIGEISSIKPEKTYGEEMKSRIDFFLTPKSSNPDNRNIYIEVKNTTWTIGKFALFPDTVTLRGQKHLKELVSCLPISKSILIPCITRTDIDYFRPGDEADPYYGKLFRVAINSGLIVLPCSFEFDKDQISWNRIIPILEDLNG
ncbi:MAG: DNA/RNA nuclease SfsA [Prochlorococcus sp. SP3034]|nr:DNA/RNA nuclease SfsA [Prochlorococcus sp. SP3034]